MEFVEGVDSRLIRSEGQVVMKIDGRMTGVVMCYTRPLIPALRSIALCHHALAQRLVFVTIIGYCSDEPPTNDHVGN